MADQLEKLKPGLPIRSAHQTLACADHHVEGSHDHTCWTFSSAANITLASFQYLSHCQEYHLPVTAISVIASVVLICFFCWSQATIFKELWADLYQNHHVGSRGFEWHLAANPSSWVRTSPTHQLRHREFVSVCQFRIWMKASGQRNYFRQAILSHPLVIFHRSKKIIAAGIQPLKLQLCSQLYLCIYDESWLINL